MHYVGYIGVFGDFASYPELAKQKKTFTLLLPKSWLMFVRLYIEARHADPCMCNLRFQLDIRSRSIHITFCRKGILVNSSK